MPRPASIDTKLKAIKSLWKKTEPRENTGGRYEDGNYTAKIGKAVLVVSQQGTVQVEWQMAFVDGAYKGKPVRKWSNLDREDSIGFLKADLMTLEIEPPETPEELADSLAEAAGKVVAITLKSKEGGSEGKVYQNIYFNDLVDEVESPAEDEEEEEEEGEDIDLDDLSKDELLELIEEEGLDIPKAKKLPEKKLRAAIEKALASKKEEDDDDEEAEDDEGEDDSEEESDDGEESEADDEDEAEVNLDEMSKNELLTYAEKIGLKLKNAKSLDVDELQEAIEEHLEAAKAPKKEKAAKKKVRR